MQCLRIGIMLVTSPPPAWSLQDGVGEVNKLQVHSCAFGQVGETLRFCDLVLHLLQVGQHGCILSLWRLASSVTHDGILHWDTHRVKFQRFIIHTSSLSVQQEVEETERDHSNVVCLR